MFFNIAVLSWGFNCTVLLHKNNLVFIVASNIFIKIYHSINVSFLSEITWCAVWHIPEHNLKQFLIC